MSIVRTYDNVDLTSTGDYISKDSTADGALKKLDAETDVIYTHLNYLQSNYYGASEPNAPQAGEVWYDSSVGYLKVYNGSTWSAVAAAAGISNVVEDTMPQLGGNLDTNGFSIVLKFHPSSLADHACSGTIDEALWTAGENLVIGDVCYLKSDGKMWKADADAAATSVGLLRMATTSISADAQGVFLKEGYIRNDTWNWSAGGIELYISVTPGNPTETAPTGNGDIKRIIGHAITPDIIEFKPSTSYVEISA